MSKRRAEGFLRGALILSLAGLVTRLMGVLYKPVIKRIFAPFDGHAGNVGVGLTQVPLTTYQVILSFTSVGLNVGISRLVAERLALGDVRGARRVFRVSLLLMAVLGLAGTLLMWFGAPWIATLSSEDLADTIPGFRATAPALFVTSLMAAYRGLFQGFQQMTPNGASQILEQIVRVTSGIVLTYVLVRRSVPLGAAGFNLGDLLGALAALGYLLYLVRKAGHSLWELPDDAWSRDGPALPGRLTAGVSGGTPRGGPVHGGAAAEAAAFRPRETPWQLVRRILAVSTPVALAGAVVPLMGLADQFFVFRGLARMGIRGDDASAQYGLLTNAFMIAWLPSIVTGAIYTSILPAVAQALARGQMGEARRRAGQAYRVTFALGIPAQVGLYVLAAGIYALIFGDATGGQVMAAMSWVVVPSMIQQTTSGVLQGMGRMVLPVRNFFIGAAVKAALTAWWTTIWGIDGAAYASAAGFGLAALLNLIYIERLLGRTLMTRSMVLKPLAAALTMAAALALLRHPLGTSHLTTLLLVAAGGLVYGLALLVVGGVRRQEVEMVPVVGRPAANLLGRTRLLR